jgi:hypothetical protein
VLAVLLIAAGLLLARRTPAPKLIDTNIPVISAPIIYRETAPIPTGMPDARGIAVAQGRLYVAGETALKEYDLHGARIRTIPLAYPIGPARCVSVSPSGVIYLGGKGGVSRIAGRGKSMLATPWPHDPKVTITSLAAGEKIIWAADAAGRRVVGYTPAGKPVVTLTGFTIPSGHFDVAGNDQGVAVSDPGGNGRVKRFRRDGTEARGWGSAGMADGYFSGCCNPAHLARLPGGGVVTSEKGLPRVQIFDADGALQGLLADPATFTGNPDGMDLATDPAGRIYVLDIARQQVRVFARK